jgi:hypothetical protein
VADSSADLQTGGGTKLQVHFVPISPRMAGSGGEEAEMPEWAIAVLTGLVTFGGTMLTMHAKVRRDLEASYDKALYDRRMTAYASLWALTEPFARYSPSGPLSPNGARALSERLRRWYFREGIVMSRVVRDAYFALQDALTADRIAAASTASPLAQSAIEDLRTLSSAMRTALSKDLSARRPPLIATDRPKG